MDNICLILLAGGKGERFGAIMPKQFLPLGEKPVVCHSLDAFLSLPEVKEVIVVVKEEFRPFFKNYPNLLFADPGDRRQDSLFNGLQKVSSNIPWVCVHDAARPLIKPSTIQNLFREGKKAKAATLGIPTRVTVKESTHDNFVLRTLKREMIWEIQTPQFISKDLLVQGFKLAQEKNMTVTDDVSLVELLDHPVKLVEGSPSNIKITHFEDLAFVRHLLEQ